jgi:hypothetical protein
VLVLEFHRSDGILIQRCQMSLERALVMGGTVAVLSPIALIAVGKLGKSTKGLGHRSSGTIRQVKLADHSLVSISIG